MSSSLNDSLLMSLPNELLHHIFSYLNFIDRSKVAEVNILFKKLVEEKWDKKNTQNYIKLMLTLKNKIFESNFPLSGRYYLYKYINGPFVIDETSIYHLVVRGGSYRYLLKSKCCYFYFKANMMERKNRFHWRNIFNNKKIIEIRNNIYYTSFCGLKLLNNTMESHIEPLSPDEMENLEAIQTYINGLLAEILAKKDLR